MKNYPKTTKFCLVLLCFVLSTMISYAQCATGISWAVWSDTAVQNTRAIGNITYRDHVVDVRVNANYDLYSYPFIWRYEVFEKYPYPIPDISTPITDWADTMRAKPGITTTCFSEKVRNPVLLIASLGQIDVPVTLQFSHPYVVLYNGEEITYIDNKTLKGEEGYVIIMFPGEMDCITATTTDQESWANFNWALTLPAFSDTTVSICEGETFKGHSVSGTYADTISVSPYCDSIAIVRLQVLNKKHADIRLTICDGDQYMGYTKTGDYTDTLSAYSGCDSIRTLHLTVAEQLTTDITRSICQGSSFLGYSGSGNYIDTLKAHSGCDSIRRLYLTVRPRPVYDTTLVICEGKSYDGYTTSGDYTNTFTAQNSCDSIRNLHLTVTAPAVYDTTVIICQGKDFEGYATSGDYEDTFTSSIGCDSTRRLHLTVTAPPEPDLGHDRQLCTGDTLVLYPGEFNHYTWQDGSAYQQLVVRKGGHYSVEVDNGCETKSDYIYINETICTIILPTAFSPNGDGLNDVFRVGNGFSTEQFYLAVYNKWGQKIYETTHVNEGWDGYVNNKLAVVDVYVWVCRYRKNGQVTALKGTVTLFH